MKPTKTIIAFCLSGLMLTGCSLPGLSGPSQQTIRIGTMVTSESEILGQIVALLIEEETDLQTELITKLGSSVVQHQALVQGDLDITAARYTGTDLSAALGMDPVTDRDEAMDIVKREFSERFDQTWFDSYGFENTYALSVTEAFADEHGIETISDLEAFAPELRFGVDNSWVNRKGDGYQGFQESYFAFGNVFPMNVGLVYEANASGHMDVVLAYSSDGRIQEYNLKVLEDDRRFFPPYDASPVVRNEVLEQYPELSPLLERLTGTITTEKMQELNYMADVELKNPRLVAQTFLEENNYFKDKGESH
ncbi:glycine betaine/carnitine/choline-binding protein OpuCC [Shouchella clausii]|uniref:osmoprotectant ABC transporter substrate-binding protein n=1 Tax=Shouchella clausii TaxID=79880 RepID=UPI001B169F82|nr:osmoprotectant ABC transporter substrate-binding protein [Shouchella clausii]GIN15343.1 glycine betaine/carnitine/choline-binding protein OpuCC [Shouchella clausii]